jgi:hypothetical protein
MQGVRVGVDRICDTSHISLQFSHISLHVSRIFIGFSSIPDMLDI